MFGYETHIIEVPQSLNSSPRWIGKKFGPRKKLTASQNTTISAIGVLGQKGIIIQPKPPELAIYHNPFAAIPLDRKSLNSIPGIVQFEMKEAQVQRFCDWSQIDA